MNEIKKLYLSDKTPLSDFLFIADKTRKRFKKNDIELCSIVNAKSGNCSEDCRFCAQSARYRAKIDRYPLLPAKDIVKAAKSAAANKATCFGIVTSGRSINSPEEVRNIAAAVQKIKKEIPLLKCSASLGSIPRIFMRELKQAGLDRFHHNPETSENFFRRMCTTHPYKERIKTIADAKKEGLGICAGGIFGLGEKRKDRLALAIALRDLGVESVPLNFLHPIQGTPLEDAKPLPPQEILRTIAMFRLVLPKADIKVCAGRIVNLRDLQSMIFFAGASGMMIGNYLTQQGRSPALDLQMIKDLGLNIK
ncbi:MAG: biotin synthase BioB [Candidatus Omnitrophica bacterium]|nr:biotin synthase BioB [Candidatus Omnitrophota bacterium]